MSFMIYTYVWTMCFIRKLHNNDSNLLAYVRMKIGVGGDLIFFLQSPNSNFTMKTKLAQYDTLEFRLRLIKQSRVHKNLQRDTPLRSATFGAGVNIQSYNVSDLTRFDYTVFQV